MPCAVPIDAVHGYADVTPQVNRCLVGRRAAPASTAHALDVLILLELGPRHSADTRRVEVRLLGLDAPQAAELLDAVST